MKLMENVFRNNSAVLGGGGIYFKNQLLAESPYQNNTFTKNKAYFANDFFTYPVRLKFTDNQTFHSWINKTSYSLIVIPGISQLSLYFDVVDYYGQTIKSINGGFYFFLFSVIFYFIQDILLHNLNP